MPGPTSRDTYIGRSRGATLAAVAVKRAARVKDLPPCAVCGRPMTCGQDRLNGGAHFVCRPMVGSHAQ